MIIQAPIILYSVILIINSDRIHEE